MDPLPCFPLPFQAEMRLCTGSSCKRILPVARATPSWVSTGRRRVVAKPSPHGGAEAEPLPAPYLSCVKHFARWAVVGAGTLRQIFNQPSDQSILNNGCQSRSAAPEARNPRSVGFWIEILGTASGNLGLASVDHQDLAV